MLTTVLGDFTPGPGLSHSFFMDFFTIFFNRSLIQNNNRHAGFDWVGNGLLLIKDDY